MENDILYLPKAAGGKKVYYVSGRDIRNYRRPQHRPQPRFTPWTLMDALDRYFDIESIPQDIFYAAVFDKTMKMTEFVELRSLKQEYLEDAAGFFIMKRKDSFDDEDADFYTLAEKSYGALCNFDYIVIKNRLPYSMKKYSKRLREKEVAS